MRRLVYLVLGFGGGCGLWAYGESAWVCLAGAGVLTLFGALAGRDARFWQRAGLVLAGCLLAFGWCRGYQGVYLADALALDGVTREAELRIGDYGAPSDYGTVAEGSLSLGRKRYRVRIYFSEELELTPGDAVYGSFRFRYTPPGGQEEAAYHGGTGVFLLAYQRDLVTITDREPAFRDLPSRIRRKVSRILREQFPEDTVSFAAALLLGDTSGLSYGVDTALKLSGIRHVAAVSGLHVSILFGFLGAVTARRRGLMVLLGFPMLALFAAVAGFTPSVSRACLMSGLMLLGLLGKREYDGPTALSFAVLVILLMNPLAVTAVSLQLSVASVAGMYLFGEGIRRWMGSRLEGWGNLGSWIASSASVSLSAMVLTTPLSAWYFGTVSLVSPLTNLLTLWVISAIFYGILGVCGLALVLPGAAKALAWAVSWGIRYVLQVAQVLSKLPMGAVFLETVYLVLWLVFVYGLLFLFWRRENRKPLVLACCAVIGLCGALLASWGELRPGQVSLTVLDVGQGQCLIFRSEGRTFLVDCGGDSDSASADKAAAWLLSRGISRLDGVLLTHLDRDHAGGAEKLLQRMETELLVVPDVPAELEGLARGRVVYASQPMELAYGTTKIHIYPGTFPGNRNEISFCILFDTEKCDILVTGDRSGFGERLLLRSVALPKVDVLIAGHHGSANSTCPELLAAVEPEMVCISAGRNNPYGHPAPALLERLEAFGCRVYRTDQQGTIFIRR